MRLDSVSHRDRRRFGLDRFELTPTRVWLVGGLLLWALYAGAFLITGTSTLARAPVDALANAASLVLAASVTHVVLRAHVLALRPAQQVAAHVLAAPVFAFGWYAMIGMLLGFLTGVRGGSFRRSCHFSCRSSRLRPTDASMSASRLENGAITSVGPEPIAGRVTAKRKSTILPAAMARCAAKVADAAMA